MDVRELRHLAERDKNTQIRLFNPLLTDFSVKFNDGSGQKEYTIKAREIASFPTPIANHIKKHLIDALNTIKDNLEIEIETIETKKQ